MKGDDVFLNSSAVRVNIADEPDVKDNIQDGSSLLFLVRGGICFPFGGGHGLKFLVTVVNGRCPTPEV